MKGLYLSNTFSPMMLGDSCKAEVKPCLIEEVKENLCVLDSVISHEITAKIISSLLGEEIKFNRVDVTLESGSIMYALIPKFRASEAREFTQEEVEGAGYRCFKIKVWSTRLVDSSNLYSE